MRRSQPGCGRRFASPIAPPACRCLTMALGLGPPPAWAQPDARSIIQPEPSPLRLLLPDLQLVASPDEPNPVRDHLPARRLSICRSFATICSELRSFLGIRFLLPTGFSQIPRFRKIRSGRVSITGSASNALRLPWDCDQHPLIAMPNTWPTDQISRANNLAVGATPTKFSRSAAVSQEGLVRANSIFLLPGQYPHTDIELPRRHQFQIMGTMAAAVSSSSASAMCLE